MDLGTDSPSFLQINLLKIKIARSVALSLALISSLHATPAQEVVIPDPGLNTAIRETLNRPTEAEWECAERAGSTNRFHYGDDPNLTDLPNYAWFGAHNGVTTHPVGLKLANTWGLYDMAGNVWEWCQDWYGSYPGGSVTDPQGPTTNPIGWKVIRGGAWESSEFYCRPASRGFEGASPFISDFIIGFRVVLASDS